MFTFLRKIRRSLISAGSARKYMLYAFGEIILVVMGILIALQINAIKIDKDHAVLEQKFLQNIHEDISKDTARLNFLMLVYQQRNDDCTWFLRQIRHPELHNELNELEFLIRLEHMYMSYDEVQNSSTFEAAKFSGAFPDFKNQNLLRTIAKYYANMGHKSAGLIETKMWLNQNLEPIMRDLPSMSYFLSQNRKQNSSSEFDLSKSYQLTSDIGDTRINKFPFKELLKNNRLEWFFNGDLGRNIYFIEILQNEMRQAKEILAEIAGILQ